MYRLLELLHSYRAFLLLIFFEIVCFWLLIRSNPYHSAAYFHTSSALVGNIYQTRKNITRYFSLPQVNEELANDNALLRELLSQSQVPIIVDTKTDSLKATKSDYSHEYLAAKVINNSVQMIHNHLTINKGSANGVEPGMGVINANGIVGKVMSVSKNFATVSSLLNTNVFVSAYIKRSNTFCSVNWDGNSITQTKLRYVPRHIELQQGDTIMTSGYNSIFPENIMIGYIDDYSIKDTDSWYDIDINLSNDFASLSYVYVIKNPDRDERVDLESEIELTDE